MLSFLIYIGNVYVNCSNQENTTDSEVSFYYQLTHVDKHITALSLRFLQKKWEDWESLNLKVSNQSGVMWLWLYKMLFLISHLAEIIVAATDDWTPTMFQVLNHSICNHEL